MEGLLGPIHENPINSCQIGAQCTIMRAKRDLVYPVGFSDLLRTHHGITAPHLRCTNNLSSIPSTAKKCFNNDITDEIRL
jgi:hypothetical protein